MNLTENQKKWIKWMLKGMGLDGSPKEFTKKERLEMQILLDNNLAYLGKNHSKAKYPMYYIPNEHQNRIKEYLENSNKDQHTINQ